MSEEFEKANPFIKIKVTSELIPHLFGKTYKPVICLRGLEGDYKCVGVIQNSQDGTFEFLLSNKYATEGMLATPFVPEFSNYQSEDMLKIEKDLKKIELNAAKAYNKYG